MTMEAKLFDMAAERETRRGTRTSSFGVSDRTNHDSTAFYDLMPHPAMAVSQGPPVSLEGPNKIEVGDALNLDLPDRCAGLVFTSPPYGVGKDYDLDQPFEDYLAMLEAAFTEAFRILEHGGRIMVNVAGLGRQPYVPLPGIVATMLAEVGFTLAGEIVWVKSMAPRSMAKGTFFSPQHPVIEDLSERIVMAVKGDFGRVPKVKERRQQGLPFTGDMDVDALQRKNWLSWASDLWFVPPVSATKIGHPCPFPPELAERAIRMYSFRDDLVVDPFAGSGTTCHVAHEFGRRFYGVDLDPKYVALAQQRLSGVTPCLFDSEVER